MRDNAPSTGLPGGNSPAAGDRTVRELILDLALGDASRRRAAGAAIVRLDRGVTDLQSEPRPFARSPEAEETLRLAIRQVFLDPAFPALAVMQALIRYITTVHRACFSRWFGDRATPEQLAEEIADVASRHVFLAAIKVLVSAGPGAHAAIPDLVEMMAVKVEAGILSSSLLGIYAASAIAGMEERAAPGFDAVFAFYAQNRDECVGRAVCRLVRGCPGLESRLLEYAAGGDEGLGAAAIGILADLSPSNPRAIALLQQILTDREDRQTEAARALVKMARTDPAVRRLVGTVREWRRARHGSEAPTRVRMDPAARFVREGRSLGEWLVDLAAPDCGVRKKAGEVLYAMQLGLPSIHSDLEDVEVDDQAGALFAAAVRDAAAAPGFPAAAVATRLVSEFHRVQTEWQRVVEEALAQRRFPGLPQDMTTSAALGEVIASLGPAAAAALPELTVMLTEKEPALCSEIAARALADMGVAALPAADTLLTVAYARAGCQYPDAWAEAVASLAAVVPSVFARLKADLGHADSAVRAGASHILAVAGGRIPLDVPLLLAAACDSDPGVRRGAAAALAHAAPGNSEALGMVLRLSSDPDESVRCAAAQGLGRAGDAPGALDALLRLARDESGYVRDSAMIVLQDFEGHDDHIVSVLVPALADPGEADCDIVGGALKALRRRPAHAAPAVPQLIRMLDAREEIGVAIELLGAIGPAAAPALPALEALLEEWMADDPFLESDGARALEVAIARVRGASAGQ